ncbi:MAG: ABC transporter permease [Candidatus Micrarchaeia archaeon]
MIYINKYLPVFKIYMKELLVYRGSFVLRILLSILSDLIFIFVWIAVYMSSNISSLNGITLTGMIIYFFVLGSLNYMQYPEIAEIIQETIRSGEINNYLIRPIKYSYSIFISILPENIIFLLFELIPVLILIYLLAGLHISLINIIIFAIEVVIAFAIITLIGFIIGSLSIYITNIYGIINGINSIFFVGGGGMIPLILYPKIIYNILMLTPLPYLYFIPAATFVGLIPTSELPGILLIGVIWIAVLMLLAKFAWSKASKDMNVVGV